MANIITNEKVWEVTGVVFEIQRFRLHDGPGIRTLVLMKGCPLRCEWCANPESQDPSPQLIYYKNNCTGCYSCVNVCPNGQYFKNVQDVNWEKCRRCFRCVDACLYDARNVCGTRMTVGKVLDVVKRDRVFYEKSQGGVTVGGGEATLQPKFTETLLKACHEEGIHTALETCGFTSWDVFGRILPHLDLLLFDIKQMDPRKHRQKTGCSNEVILENAKKASRVVKEMIVRYPLIPGFNDTMENVKQMAWFITGEMPRVKKIDILPYHTLGVSKCETIGKPYRFKHEHDLSKEKLEQIKGFFESFHFQVSIIG